MNAENEFAEEKENRVHESFEWSEICRYQVNWNERIFIEFNLSFCIWMNLINNK